MQCNLCKLFIPCKLYVLRISPFQLKLYSVLHKLVEVWLLLMWLMLKVQMLLGVVKLRKYAGMLKVLDMLGPLLWLQDASANLLGKAEVGLLVLQSHHSILRPRLVSRLLVNVPRQSPRHVSPRGLRLALLLLP